MARAYSPNIMLDKLDLTWIKLGLGLLNLEKWVFQIFKISRKEELFKVDDNKFLLEKGNVERPCSEEI